MSINKRDNEDTFKVRKKEEEDENVKANVKMCNINYIS